MAIARDWSMGSVKQAFDIESAAAIFQASDDLSLFQPLSSSSDESVGPGSLVNVFAKVNVTVSVNVLAAVNVGVAAFVIVIVSASTVGSGPGWDDENPLNPLPMDPLVLDLDRDGIELTSVTDSDVYFDFDNDGFLERGGWVSPDDGLLVRDLNNNGTIDNLSELIGTELTDGYSILAALDENDDGVIDQNDQVFNELKVWRDLNQDGNTDSGELFSLAELDIASLSVVGTPGELVIAGNAVPLTSTYTLSDGTTGATGAVYFETDQLLSIWVPPEGFVVNEDAGRLPYLKGYGDVPDTLYALTMDEDLRQDWSEFRTVSQNLTGKELRHEFESLLQRWAGVQDTDPTSRGPYVNAAHLAFVEKFYGTTFSQMRGGVTYHNPFAASGEVVERVYEKMVSAMLVHYLSQAAFSIYVTSGGDQYAAESNVWYPFYFLSYDEATDRVGGDVVGVAELLVQRAPPEIREQFAYYDLILEGLRGVAVDNYASNSAELISDLSPALDGIGDQALQQFAVARLTGLELVETGVGTDGSEIVHLGVAGGDAKGGAGDDFYIYVHGDGDLTIEEQSSGGIDRVLLVGVDPTAVTLSREGNHLTLVIAESSSGAGDGGLILLKNSLDEVNGQGLEQVVFADGTVWSRADLRLMLLAQASTSGNDTITGFNVADVISGGAGDDTLYGRDGDDILTGGTGNDRLVGGWGGDTYVFNLGDGQDVIADDGYSGSDTLEFGAGVTAADLVVTATNNGNDMVIAIAGTTDQITIQGGITSGGYKIEQVRFADGSTLSYAQLFEMTVVPTAGNDTLYGDERGNALSGGAGDDTLYGRDGDDILTGGTGNDRLVGGWGGDTYVFNLGDGQDVIADDGYSGSDTLEFGAGITAADLVVTATNNGNDMVIAIAGTTDQITIQGGITSGGYKIEQVRFADGSTLSYAQLFEMTVVPTAGNDTLYGDERGNALSGGAGDDTLYGRDGDDILTGGTGNDRLVGGWGGDTYVFNLGDGQDVIADDGYSGSDTLEFGAGITAADLVVTATNNGNDMVIAIAGTTDQITIQGGITSGGYKIEQVRFADGSTLSYAQLFEMTVVPTAGNDTLYGDERGNALSGGAGDDTLYGRDGDDILTGGTGNDRLVGGWGGDTYVFNLGDGQDVIADDGYSGSDTLEFGAGITAADLVVTATNNGNDMVIAIAGTTDQITIQGGITSGGYKIEQVRFADGSTLSFADLLVRASGATAGNDTLYGDERGNALSGGAGDDTLYGRDGDDILTGGTGNDRLVGGWGGDTYVFNLGDGQDVIADDGYSGSDTLEFGAGVTAADLVVTATNNGNDMVIAIAGTTDQITIQGGITSGGYKIEQVRFADGSTLSYAQLFEMTVVPTAGNDTLYGDERGNALSGGAGDDTLYGRDGDDILTGGTGNDRLVGGWGGDTYVFNLGDGQDVIADDGYSGSDTLEFGAGITAADLVVTATNNGNDMVIAIAGTTDQITIQGGITSGGYKIEQVRFADGSTLSYAQLFEMTVVPTAGNDTLYGDERGNALSGGAGDDTLYGRDGDDILTGGTGNDRLVGGWGGDTYVFNLGDGQDVIADDGYSGSDTLEFGAGITAADLVVTATNNGNDMVIAIAGTTDQITIQGGITSGGYKIEQVRFADGSTLSYAQLFEMTVVPTAGNDTLYGDERGNALSGGAGDDTLYGRDGDDILTGGTGNDRLVGDWGNDTYVYARGDGNDVIDDQIGANKLIFQGIATSEINFVRNGNDIILALGTGGVDGRITLRGQLNSSGKITTVQFDDGTVWTDQTISGLAVVNDGTVLTHAGTDGADTIYGTSDIDVMDGGAGADVLRGGSGSDTYRWGISSGNDTIVEDGGASDVDTIRLLGLNVADVTFGRLGNHLYITINSTGEVLKVQDHFNSTNYGVEQVRFADNTSWDRAQILAAAWFIGTSAGETIDGSSGNDTIDGRGGNDRLVGHGGADTYLFGLGSDNDTIAEGSVASDGSGDTVKLVGLNIADVEFSRSGNDLFVKVVSSGETLKVENQFNGDNGIETVAFANGTSWDRNQIVAASWYRGGTGDDSISSSSGSDILSGGLGNDYLRGNAGSDLYVYTSGDGNDRIDDESASTAEIDTLRFTDLNASDLTFSRVGGDLAISVIATGQIVTVNYQFYSKTANWGIEKIEFADGTSWDLATINSHALIRGTSGNDTIGGSDWNDIFWGGLGNDRFNSGAGSDTYFYALGDGNDYIDDESGSTADVDVLHLTDLNASDLTFSRVGVNLVATVNANGQTVTFDEQFYSKTANWGIEKIEFADGSSWDLATINSHAWIRGTSGNDTIGGSDWNDIFSGGLGDDRFNSGAGSDTYVYALGDGNDYINDESGSTADVDVLRLTDLNASDLTFSRVGVNLVATVNANGQTITFDEQFYSQTANWGVEKIEFANGTSWDLAQINASAWIRGTGGNDTLNGTAWNDTLLGNAGNDILTGGAGSDKFVFGAGFGQDRITDFAAGTDKIEFHDGLFADASAALAAATQSGSDTLITIDATTSILLQNVAVANLNADDFRVL